MDHFERARREEEAPLLDAAFAEKVRLCVPRWVSVQGQGL